MTSPIGISARSLSCSLGGRPILESISFDIAGGEFVSVIGPNGAGKTTLLRCLMKILPLESGSIAVGGADISRMKQKEVALRAAYVPQADSRYLPFTVEEFVMTGRYPYLSPFSACSHEDRSSVREAMRMTGMDAFSSRRMSSLSGGERQMVMIAAALAQGAGMMLLDEPAAFLDPSHESSIMRILARINESKGNTVVMVTHDINRAILSSSRCMVLDRGRVEYFGDPRELPGSGVLENIYGRKFEYIRHPSAGCDILLPEVSGDELKA
jgi:iron complex transport system ATP-binding protein